MPMNYEGEKPGRKKRRLLLFVYVVREQGRG